MADLYDNSGRRIHYLRIAVTDRCNFRCQYCMPSGDIAWVANEDILSYAEMLRLIGIFARLGIDKVRITGGEPLLREGIVPFLKAVTQIAGIAEVSLTTNGSRLSEYALLLKEAGIGRINVSLDTLSREKFISITGQDALPQVLAGIERACAVGLAPIKINMVVMKGVNDDELADFAALTIDKPYQVRFIEYMPFGAKQNYLLTAADMRQRLAAAGYQEMIPAAGSFSVAKVFQLPSAQGTIGFITPVSQHFCHSCNRIRLTPEGHLKPCLLTANEYSLRELLRQGVSDDDLLHICAGLVSGKPRQYTMENTRSMYAIGG